MAHKNSHSAPRKKGGALKIVLVLLVLLLEMCIRDSGSSYGSHSGSVGGPGGFGSGYSRPAVPKTPAKQINFTGTPAAKTNANTTKHYEPGDVVEHKVFGQGTVVAVKPAAGDQIVEILSLIHI